MQLIPDDPIIQCIRRSGFPPWLETPGAAESGEKDPD